MCGGDFGCGWCLGSFFCLVFFFGRDFFFFVGFFFFFCARFFFGGGLALLWKALFVRYAVLDAAAKGYFICKFKLIAYRDSSRNSR